MNYKRILDIVRRRYLTFFCTLMVGLAGLVWLSLIVPNDFAAISHVMLVADNGARDPALSVVDLPSIATSTVVLQRVRGALDVSESLIDMKQDVSAKVLSRSTIMAIGFRDASSERAIAVSNGIADQLAQYYNQLSTQQYDVNVDRLSAELDAKAHKLHALERTLGEIGARNPYVLTDKSVDVLTTDLASLGQQRALAEAQRDGDMALADTSSGGGKSRTARHEILAGDLQFQNIRAAVARDAAQLVTDQAGYARDFPGLRGERAKLVAEVASLHRQAQRALDDPDAFSASSAGTRATHVRQLALIKGDEAKVDQLRGLMAVRQHYLDDYATTGTSYAQVRADRDVTQAEYLSLATRRANALSNRAEASLLGSVVVLDRAIKADTQLSGGRTRAILVLLVLIVALAIGAALLAEQLDPRLRRIEQVEALYGVPVIANVRAKS